MMAAEAGTTFVRIEKRFGIAEAHRLREALEPLAPLRDVRIDFRAADGVDDAALAVVAELLTRSPGCRFRLEGLTQHKRRLLRYMGVR